MGTNSHHNTGVRRTAKVVLEIVAVTVLYMVAAQIGFRVAVQPGNVTPLWPPSGLALASILLLGRKSAIGIWLGSFLINVWLLTAQLPLPASIAVATVIALGSTLQALLIAYVLQRWFGSLITRPQMRVLLKFVGVVALTCVTGASIGVFTLWRADLVAPSALLSTWAIWWIGDVLGMVVFGPILLVLGRWARGESIERQVPPVLFGLGVGLALSLSLLLWTQESAAIKVRFSEEAHMTVGSVQKSIDADVKDLGSIHGLYASSLDISRSEFYTYTTFQAHDMDASGLIALEWLPRVTAAERPAKEAELQSVGIPGAQFTELNAEGELVRAANRDEYFPVYFVEPLAGNEPALGFDPTSDPVRKAALAEARDLARPYISEPITLIQAPEGRYGILNVHPIYRNGVFGETVDERRANLIGFVVGVFNMREMVNAALTLPSAGAYDVYLFDMREPVGQQLVYARPAPNRAEALQVDPATSPTSLYSGLYDTHRLEMDGHTWLAVVKPMPGYAISQRTMIPGIVLAIGVAFATLLAAYLARRQQAEATLRESKGELARSQAIAHLGSFVWDKRTGKMTWSDELTRIMGCENAETSQSLFFAMIHPDDRARFRAAGLERSGAPFSCEYRIVQPNGTIRWVRNQLERLPLGDDSAGQWFGTFQDISEQRLIDLGLRRAEKLLEARLRLSEIASTHALETVLTAIVDQAEAQTDSQIALMHRVDEEMTRTLPQTWSTNTLRVCAICPLADQPPLHEDSLWAGRVLTGEAQFFNNAAEIERYRVFPEGHVPLERLMVAPILRGGSVVALLAVGNKPVDYDENDRTFLEQYAEAAWDIALRKRAEAALQESEDRYRHLIENSHDLVQSIAPDGHFLFVNRIWSETLGYAPEDLTALTWWDLVHPEALDQCKAEFNQLLQSETAEAIHPVLVAKNGRILDLEGTATARVIDGVVVATHAFVRDVTEERQTERIQAAQYAVSNILADSPELDAALPLLVETMARQLGWQVAELWWRNAEGTRLDRSIVWQEPGNPALDQFVAQSQGFILNRGENIPGQLWTEKHAISIANYTKRGYPRSAMAAAANLCAAFVVPIDTGSDFLGSLLFFSHSEREQDARLFVALTNLGRQLGQFVARKIAESELRAERASLANRVDKRTADLSRANTQLERAMRAKDEFLANMSHELRTPLNGILVLSESLREQMIGPLNERQVRSMGLIEDSGRHLLALINDILDLSKLEVGKLEIQPEVIIVQDICLSSLAFVKQMAQKKGIQVVYTQRVPNIMMLADARRLKQILVNLLSNAVKFTDPGGEVLLEVNVAPEQGVIEFAVQDTGIGIPKDALGELFQPFAQVDSSLSRQHEGTGLGLALVRNLVDLHGGTVTVESDGVPGRGSRFTVSLPWRKGNADATPNGTASPSALRQAQTGAAGKGAPSTLGGLPASADERQPMILLADDNEINVSAFSDFLSTAGYQVAIAHNGIEALARAAEVNPDLILMDVQMPEMDGLEAMRRLRTDPRFVRTPIIALTALAMAGDRERCIAAGANSYVSKPVGLKELVGLIEQLRRPLESV